VTNDERAPADKQGGAQTGQQIVVEHVRGVRTVRARPRWLAPVPVVVLASLLVLLVLVVWLVRGRGPTEQEVEPVVEVEIAPPTRAEVREYVEAGGTLNALPGREASFSAATAGRVARVLVQVGEHVSTGQTLAELDRSVLAAQVRQAAAAVQQARATAVQAQGAAGAQSQTIAADQIRQAEAALAQARANLLQAQSTLTRQQTLFARGIVARKDVEDAQTQVAVTNASVSQAESALAAARVNAARGVGEARTQATVSVGGVAAAQAALAVAQAELARAAIRAPISGTVTKRAINDGETVDPATPAFEVIDTATLDLVANLPAEYLGRIKTGDLASVRVEPFPDKEFSGGVVQVAPAVEPQTNTVAVRVRLANPQGELKAGLYANARIAVEIHHDALVVPEAALVVEGDETFLFVAHEEKVEKRKVTVGIRDAGRAEIAAGLKDGEQIVTTGAFGLSDGAQIKIVPAPEADEGKDSKAGAATDTAAPGKPAREGAEK
jgi:multidrug efflux pump subunit AcrA (membrane-fusion protein)